MKPGVEKKPTRATYRCEPQHLGTPNLRPYYLKTRLPPPLTLPRQREKTTGRLGDITDKSTPVDQINAETAPCEKNVLKTPSTTGSQPPPKY